MHASRNGNSEVVRLLKEKYYKNLKKFDPSNNSSDEKSLD
jgi:hypothetical protein